MFLIMYTGVIWVSFHFANMVVVATWVKNLLIAGRQAAADV